MRSGGAEVKRSWIASGSLSIIVTTQTHETEIIHSIDAWIITHKTRYPLVRHTPPFKMAIY